jgi:hypothetical protein
VKIGGKFTGSGTNNTQGEDREGIPGGNDKRAQPSCVLAPVRPRYSRAHRASSSSERSKDPERQKSVPTTRLSYFLHSEVHLPWVSGGQQPSSIGAPLPSNCLHRVSESIVPRMASGTKVIECAQNVELPARRKCKAQELRTDRFTCALRAVKSMSKHELA